MFIKWLLAALILIVVFELFRVRSLIKISSTLTGGSKPYEQHPISPKYKVLIIGDSTGVGTGADNPALTLAGRIGTDYPDADITNVSRNGLRTDQLNTKLSGLDSRYDLVILHVGGNDIIRFKSLGNSANNIEKAVSSLSKKSQKVAVFTTGNMGESEFFPFLTRPIFYLRSRSLRDKTTELIGNHRNVYYVDLFGYPKQLKSVNGYAKDKLHLSDSGYSLWYEALVDTLKPNKLLEQ